MGILSSGDSGHRGTESPLHESMNFWWGFRPVGIPSSGDSRYIPFKSIDDLLDSVSKMYLLITEMFF